MEWNPAGACSSRNVSSLHLVIRTPEAPRRIRPCEETAHDVIETHASADQGHICRRHASCLGMAQTQSIESTQAKIPLYFGASPTPSTATAARAALLRSPADKGPAFPRALR